MGILIKFAQNDVNIYISAFFRFMIGFIFIFPYIWKTNFVVYKTKNIKTHIIRSLLNMPAILLLAPLGLNFSLTSPFLLQ